METTPQSSTTEVATQQSQLPVIDLNGSALPDLSTATAAPVDLMADYWTPENPGETKRMIFDKIASRLVIDQQTQESIELDCAYFVEVVSGEAKSISNGSKRLVGAIQSNNIRRGTPLEVKYLGKKKNKSNAFQSDNWSIKPLVISI